MRRWVSGCWELMAAGAWGCGTGAPTLDYRFNTLGAWTRAVLGWATPIVADMNTAATYELSPLGRGGTVLRVPIKPDEYLLIEYREGAPGDTKLPANGVLIYHVAESLPQFPPTLQSPYRVSLIEADDDSSLFRTEVQGGNRGTPGDVFGITRTTFRSGEHSRAKAVDGVPFFFEITDITIDAAAHRARVRVAPVLARARDAQNGSGRRPGSPSGRADVNSADVSRPFDSCRARVRCIAVEPSRRWTAGCFAGNISLSPEVAALSRRSQPHRSTDHKRVTGIRALPPVIALDTAGFGRVLVANQLARGGSSKLEQGRVESLFAAVALVGGHPPLRPPRSCTCSWERLRDRVVHRMGRGNDHFLARQGDGFERVRVCRTSNRCEAIRGILVRLRPGGCASDMGEALPST